MRTQLMDWVALCYNPYIGVSLYYTSLLPKSKDSSDSPSFTIHLDSSHALLSEHRRAPAVPANLHQGRLLVRKGHLPLLVEADVLEVSDEPGKQAIDCIS